MRGRAAPKCMPLKNWSDPTARHQIINQIVFEEYIIFSKDKTYNWKAKVKRRLEFYGIYLEESTINSIRQQLKNGKRNASASSTFGGKLYKELGSRIGKEKMYGQIDILSYLYLKKSPNKINYIGLPANQFLYLIRKYGGNIIACELNKDMFEFMKEMKNEFAPNSSAEVFNENIFEYLDRTNKRFSFFDFDLMKQINRNDVENIVCSVLKTSESISIVSVASCIGRKKTEKQHKEIMPKYFIEKIKEKSGNVLECFSGGYIDKIIPMRYELFVIQNYENW